MEQLLEIKGFENYKVSSEGYVINTNFNKTGKVGKLKPKINKQGILEITLNKHDKHYYRILARLVYETFNNIKLNKNDIIMYKDNDKTNCSYDNLYKITRGKRQEITYDNDKRYRPKYEYYGEILPTKEISKRTGIKSKTIRNRVAQQYWNIYEAAEIPIAIYKKKGDL